MYNVGDLLIATGPRNTRSLTRAELLTLIGGGAETFIKKFKQADGVPINNSSVLVADPDLQFDIGANEFWYFRTIIFWSSATERLKFGFSGPASPASLKISSNGIGTSYGNGGPFGVDAAETITDYSQFSVVPIANDFSGKQFVIELVGTIRNGPTAGIVQAKFAQYMGTVEDTKILDGSALIAQKLSA